MSIEKITTTPAAFSKHAEKINEVIKELNPLIRLEAKANGGIKITKSDTNIVLEVTGGLPAGYTFEEFTVCVDGAPETRWMVTWTSNPA